MKSNNKRAASFSLALLILLVALAGCTYSPFLNGPSSAYKQANAIATELKVSDLGKTVWTSRFGTGIFSNPPTLELQITSAHGTRSALIRRLEAAKFSIVEDSDAVLKWSRSSAFGVQTVSAHFYHAGEMTYRNRDGTGDSDQSLAKSALVQMTIESSATPVQN